jgi:hypothetical protein
MEIKKKNKVLMWTVAVLLVLNISTLSTIWIENHKENKQRMSHRSKNHGEVLINELQLNKEQIQFYQQSRKQHWTELLMKKKEILSLKKDVHQAFFNPNCDTTYIYQLIDSIGYLNAALERNNYQHFLEIKEQLDSTQLNRFHEFMGELLQRDESRLHHKLNRENDSIKHK